MYIYVFINRSKCLKSNLSFSIVQVIIGEQIPMELPASVAELKKNFMAAPIFQYTRQVGVI